MPSKKQITILGATGSVGQNTVDVIGQSPELFDVHAVTAHKNVTLLAQTAQKINARTAIIGDPTLLGDLQNLLKGSTVTAQAGFDAIVDSAGKPVDIVMNAIVGFAGLRPLIRALEQGNDVAIANKEPLVAAGEYITALARKNNATILPVDSEHNAIFQVFEQHNKGAIEKLILTASGGPFLDWDAQAIYNATPAQATAHPNWDMGAKISVDSATMMNKALEIIEAAYLFEMSGDQIDVVIHRQSVVHSLVSYKDGSMLAQMGQSDMRTPIAYALSWPERLSSGGTLLDIHALSNLTFEKPDFEKFPALHYAYKCLELGQGACIALNAANEVAVSRFLDQTIKFGDIMKCNAYIIDSLYPQLPPYALKTVEDIEKLDHTVRQESENFIRARCVV
tara:strand:- start:4751 stop:5932 length:1182 start_codon:yes stop_codon:yes gene_type:complete